MPNKLLILSAGHDIPRGDPGAVSGNNQEANWNIVICDRVKQYMDAWGFPCDYMPNNVGDLRAEIAWVNARYKNLNDGYALQVHLNAGGGTGTEFWVPSHASQTSKDIGASILNSVIEQTGLRNRGIKDASTNKWGRLGWTDDTTTYAGLIESWFVDVDASTYERAYKVAYGIAIGVCRYFGHNFGKSFEQEAADKAEADRQAQIAAQIEAERQAQAEKARLEAIAEAERVAKAKAEQERIDAELARIKAENAAKEEMAKKQAELDRQAADLKAEQEKAQIEKDKAFDDLMKELEKENNLKIPEQKGIAFRIISVIIETIKKVLNYIRGKK
jgi:hypothetical protein